MTSEAGKYLFIAAKCGGGVRSILLLPLVPRDNRCMYMAHVSFYVCCSTTD